MNWRSMLKRVLAPMLVLVLSWAMVSCSQSGSIARKPLLSRSENRLAEIAPPTAIQELKQYTDIYQPQVTILSPRPDEVLEDTQTSVKLQVRDLPLFKDEELELGYHLHFILDNQPYQAIFNVDEPIVLNDLEPGTHTIRVFASRPWHESFKNEGAFAETTFHVFTKTPEYSPNPRKPLLTYSRPKGDYGAEPVLLDFYLTNAPLHFVAQEDREDAIPDWQIRCTINGESFTFDRWEPIYLKGLKPGRNWIQLELLDENGNPLPNPFNNTVRIVNYQPNGTDALSRLIRGEIPVSIARRITDPDYTPPASESATEETTEETSVETLEPAEEILQRETTDEQTEPHPEAVPDEFDRAFEETPADIPAELKQPGEEESIREELADEVKEQFQDESEESAAGTTEKTNDDRAPMLIRPVEQPAAEPSQPNSSDRKTVSPGDKFTDKFSEARERAKGLMNRMRKGNDSAPLKENPIESVPDAPEVPPVIKTPESVAPQFPEEGFDIEPTLPPDAAPKTLRSPVLPSTPELDDLPPTLPEIIEEPQQDLPAKPAPPPSRLPAPIPRFLTLAG